MPALAELTPLVLALVALGLATLATILVYALFHPVINFLQSIPAIGGTLAYPFEKASQFLLNALGAAEAKVDSFIGAMFHVLADQFSWAWRELKDHGAALLETATIVGTLVSAYHLLRRLVHGIHSTTQGFGHAIRRLEREYHGIEHRVRVIEREIGQGIGHDLRVRVAGLEAEVGTLENKIIPSIRTAVNTAEGEVSALRKWVTDNIPLPGTKTFLAAVAVALSALGLDWLKCNSAKNVLNNRTCSLWNTLDDLLALATAVYAVAEFDTLVHDMQAVEEEVIGVAKDLFGLN